MRTGWGGLVLCAAAAVPLLLAQPGNAAEPGTVACKAPPELTRFVHPLRRVIQRLAAGDPLTIIAIGSSSTAGVGASSPETTYPSRLAVELRKAFPHDRIRVLNRGVNGEEAPDMVARFDTSVLAENPDLVLWQVGSNAVLRDDPLMPAEQFIHEGLRQLKSVGTDIVLIDPQFAPRVTAKPEAEAMVALISTSAKEANVDLFQRFAVMRYWHDKESIPFSTFLSPDGLHMNDWSYACIAQLLGNAITEAANRNSAITEAVSHNNAQSIAVTRP
jgi:acyl-CoA thioesterase-1